MRSFIALTLENSIKDELAGVQTFLKDSGADVKWVKKDNIHATLKFLGDIAEDQIRPIQAALDDIAKECAPFEITLKGIGAFPKPSFPRVIWVGMEKGITEARELAGKIEERLEELGFSKENRPFKSHITLGRVRSPKNKEALQEKMLSAAIEKDLTQKVTSIVLFKSELTPQGPLYTVIHESSF